MNGSEAASARTSRALAPALVRSYAQSLDFPELTDFCTTSNVLARNRAAGAFGLPFRPVFVCEVQRAAVLLLLRLARLEAFEIDYIGVAQVAPGTGVANAVMRRAMEADGRAGANALALSVDQRIIPARMRYRRWGFVGFADHHA